MVRGSVILLLPLFDKHRKQNVATFILQNIVKRTETKEYVAKNIWTFFLDAFFCKQKSLLSNIM